MLFFYHSLSILRSRVFSIERSSILPHLSLLFYMLFISNNNISPINMPDNIEK